MAKLAPGRQLTDAEHRQRLVAARASAAARARHDGAPSIRQGSTGDPSRRAVGLFRQGQARPDTRATRGVFDTRSTEPTVGSIKASFRLHFPEAIRAQAALEPPAKGRPGWARALAERSSAGHQDVIIQNPGTIEEAQRHPVMRELIQRSIGVVRDNMAGAIEYGHARKLIPEGTRPGQVARAYKHAALLALHKAGLGDYDFRMDDAAKADFRPLQKFMLYAYRRVFDQLNVANKGRWQPFRDEFGQVFHQKKHGKLTGQTRMRMRPNQEFVKIDGALEDGVMEKVWAANPGTRERTFSQRSDSAPAVGRENREPPQAPVRIGSMNVRGTQDGHDAHSRVRRAAALGAIAMHALHTGAPVPLPPEGLPKRPHGGLRLKHAAIAVEDHHSVPRIGGAGVLKMEKSDLSFTFGDPDMNTNPELTLRRAIHPRMRRRAFRLRLNTQRNLRRVLSGGITRQERWQLGATTRVPDSFYKAEDLSGFSSHDLHREVNRRHRLAFNRPAADRAGVEDATSPALRDSTHGDLLHEVEHRLRAAKKASRTTRSMQIMHMRGKLRGIIGKVGPLLKQSHVDLAAGDARHPTHAQAKAGNYRMAHTKAGGLPVTIETPRGRVRSGRDRTGREWRVRMPAHYGYIKRTKGADGDHVDVYLGPHAHKADEHPVFVVDQVHADSGRFDEHKAMLGFRDKAHAVSTYDAGFSDGRGPDRRGAVHEVTFADFKHWVGNGDTTAPFELKKGLIADTIRFGADYLPGVARAVAGTKSVARGAQAFGGRIAGTASRLAEHPRVAPVMAHPRVAAARTAAAHSGWRGALTPAYTGGRALGGFVGGQRGAKIGGAIGLGVDYSPQLAAAGVAAHALINRRRQKQQALPPTLVQQGVRRAENEVLGKGLIGATIGAGKTLAGAIGRSSTRTKVGLALGAGVAAPHAKRYLDRHPVTRATLGAVAGGAAAAALSRGRAVASVRAASRALYHSQLAAAGVRRANEAMQHTGLKAALRQHLGVLSGQTPGPNLAAHHAAAFSAARRVAAQKALASRKAGLAGIRASRKAVAAGAIAGGTGALIAGGRNRWADIDAANP